MTDLGPRDSFARGGRDKVLDDAAAAVSRSVSARGRTARAFVLRHDLIIIGAVWALIVFATLLWTWGLNPLVFQVTDEAVVRQAARLISQQGNPFLKLPFADPEDLAHMRQWLSMGDTALPYYAPVALYGYGLLLRFHWFGLVLIELLPSVAIGAFALGTARLLPAPRRWLALFAPLLGFASFYWALHPWMLLAPVLSCLCWAFFFWTSWRETRLKDQMSEREARRSLVAVALCVGAGSAIRPDYAGFLLLSMLLLLLASDPREWRLILALSVLAGVFAIIPNLIFNKLTTGHALRAAYQVALDRQYGADGSHGLEGSHGLPGSGVLRVLLMPLGMPGLADLGVQFKKYFVTMSVAPLLLLGQIALVPLLRAESRTARLFYLLALLLFVFFAVTHLHDGMFGADETRGYIYHSVPRYLSPLFLFGALPPLLFLGRCRRKWLFALGSALVCAVAATSGYEVYANQPASLDDIHRWVASKTWLLDTFATEIPSNAIVYSALLDKMLWSRWNIGVIVDPPELTATSIGRAVEAGLPVFVLEPKPKAQFNQLKAALRLRQFKLIKIDGRHGLYRLARLPPPAATP